MTESLELRDAGTERAEIADRLRSWIAALRSGKYQQCRGTLHAQQGGFCCLGVALDLTGEKWTDTIDSRMGGDEDGDETETFLGFVPTGNNKEPHALSDQNVDHYGMTNDEAIRLATMNDAGEPFAKIADYIERDILPRYAEPSVAGSPHTK